MSPAPHLDMASLSSAKRVAKYLNISEMTLYKYAQQGIIPALRIGKLWRFDLERIKQMATHGDFSDISAEKQRTELGKDIE